VVCFTW
jgi:triphosphatase